MLQTGKTTQGSSMTILKTFRPFVFGFTAAMALSNSAIAQVDATPAVGANYIVSEHADWTLACEKAAEGPDTCRVVQEVANSSGGMLARVSIRNFTDPSRGIAAAATVLVPLGIDLNEGLQMQIDQNPPRRYRLAYCDRSGCIAQLGFTLQELGWLKSGQKAMLYVRPHGTDSLVPIAVSLSGITAGYDALVAQDLANLSSQ